MSSRAPVVGMDFSMTPVVRALVIACSAVWLAQLLTMHAGWSFWSWFVLSAPTFLSGMFWQVVTYQFLHTPLGIAHVLFNMLMLWMFGRDVERARGGSWFLPFYLACGAGAGLLWVLLTGILPGAGAPMVGASGSVLGVMTAWAMFWPRRQVLFMLMIPIEARYFILITAAIELLLVWSPSSGVANLAHLAGMLTAWVIVRQGWRLGRVGALPATVASRLGEWRRARRRSRLKVVDRDWERWLRDNDPRDQRRH